MRKIIVENLDKKISFITKKCIDMIYIKIYIIHIYYIFIDTYITFFNIR